MGTVKERITSLEVKVKYILYLVSAQLGIKGIEVTWPPIVALFLGV